MANHLFLQLTEGILDEVLSWNPTQATQLGWSKYDTGLKDLSKEAYAHEARRLAAFIEQLERFKDEDLNDEERIDRDLGLHMFRLRLYEIKVLKEHEKRPLAADDIGDALFFLFSRDDQPLEKRVDSMTARLEKVPRHLEKSRSSLVSPCRLWTEMALETGKALGDFLDTIDAHALKMLGRNERTARLSAAVKGAKSAIERHNRWLQDAVLPVASSPVHMPAEHFSEYLKLKDFGVTPEEALRIGEAHLLKTRRQMEEVANRMVRSGSVEEAVELMKSNRPSDYDEVLARYREGIRSARDFLVEKDLATVPDGEELLVVETPNFMRRTTPFAAQFEPGKYSGDRTGLFLVTPNDDLDTIKDHCYALISNVAVHEGYPGHHLQGVCGNTHPSFVRALSASMDFGEGWALYCEELMLEHGFNDTPEGRLAQLNDLMLRVVRVVADVKLARGELTPEEVSSMLVKETGMQPQAAMDEARGYTTSPTYNLAYFIGKMALLQLMQDVKAAMGSRFSLKLFHDTLLYAGCLPVSFMRREMAMRLKDEYGIILDGPKERLAEYALRDAASQ